MQVDTNDTWERGYILGEYREPGKKLKSSTSREVISRSFSVPRASEDRKKTTGQMIAWQMSCAGGMGSDS